MPLDGMRYFGGKLRRHPLDLSCSERYRYIKSDPQAVRYLNPNQRKEVYESIKESSGDEAAKDFLRIMEEQEKESRREESIKEVTDLFEKKQWDYMKECQCQQERERIYREVLFVPD
ncbi:hypothetical protein COU57_03460 [Candidatus Pacearchaeota archaeon CG10_big_fil_rev_8_21_14_0_10_32_14]|nr:MAG: hypothetical protein COU57_03460 [Candidatus Pacearchaeota archaeon CG10_big_fil_rev_8_21_14_0_10_32_14]